MHTDETSYRRHCCNILPCAVTISRELQGELRCATHHQHLVGRLDVLLKEWQDVFVRKGGYLRCPLDGCDPEKAERDVTCEESNSERTHDTTRHEEMNMRERAAQKGTVCMSVVLHLWYVPHERPFRTQGGGGGVRHHMYRWHVQCK